MKKIISLLSVFAMIATLFTTVAFADDNNKFYVEETVDGTNVSLTFYLTTEYYLSSASATLNLTDAYAACDAITFTKGPDSNTFNVNATQKVLAWAITSAGEATGTLELGTVTFENVKSDFTLPSKRASVAKDASKVSVIANFTDGHVGYTVKAPAGEELPADRAAAVKFAADENTFVEITKGAEVKNYFLPAGVKGDATVYGLLKYTVDGTNVKSGDIFTIKAVDMETKAATDVASITVE